MYYINIIKALCCACPCANFRPWQKTAKIRNSKNSHHSSLPGTEIVHLQCTDCARCKHRAFRLRNPAGARCTRPTPYKTDLYAFFLVNQPEGYSGRGTIPYHLSRHLSRCKPLFLQAKGRRDKSPYSFPYILSCVCNTHRPGVYTYRCRRLYNLALLSKLYGLYGLLSQR